MKVASSQQVIDWINASPTAYHAVDVVKCELLAHGFQALNESEQWSLVPGQKYFVQRREASIIAFIYGVTPFEQDGIRLIGAHTDSPCLKVKPRPERNSLSYLRLGVEVYGGALLNPWFDRDLSIAGRVAIQHGDSIELKLVDFKRPIAFIPSLAIHLDRNANNEKTVNPQTELMPVLLQTFEGDVSSEPVTFRSMLAEELMKGGVTVNENQVLDFDLSFYDTQMASLVGYEQQFLAGARIDNQLSCFSSLYALLNSDTQHSAILALFDHEEVGSQSDIGAKSNFLNAFIERIIPCTETRYRTLHRSLMVSLDNAHGIHPNYPAKHDENHGPILNKGPVLKFDANQGYATSSDSAAIIRVLARESNVPIQTYVTRADLRCGSTIGPMSSAQTGIRTVDIGAPTLGMHSIRELAGVKDVDHTVGLLSAYLKLRTLSP